MFEKLACANRNYANPKALDYFLNSFKKQPTRRGDF